MKKINLFYMLFIFSAYGFSQNSLVEPAFWKLTSLNGELYLNGEYWEQQTVRNNYTEELNSTLFSGGLFLNSKSYFYHPNFLEVTLDAGYSPETGQRLSLVAPDQAETNTLKKLYTQFSFFQHAALNLKVFANINEGYSNRENLTNLKTNFQNFGGTLAYSNKFLPVSVTYNKGSSELQELQTGRSYKTENNSIEGRAFKSFGRNDTHQFIFSQNKYVYDDQFMALNQIQSGTLIENKITSLSLNDNIYFDTKKNYNFNSLVSQENQIGNNLDYKRLQVIENLFFKLPYKFNFSSNYNFFDIKQNTIASKQQNASASLTHLLYESLYTSVNYEYNTINSTQFKETNKRTGFEARYVKKIPLKGLLTLQYKLNTNEQDRTSEDLVLTILNEAYTITDGQIVLLKNQSVNVLSVLVKDVTGTIIYQENLDYILIVRNDFLEIQRIPGGQIANNSTVFIDYGATQPSSYKYNAVTTNYGANIAFFNNKIEFFYSKGKQDFLDPVNVDFFTLDYYTQNVYGGRFNLGFLSGEIEQDNFNSTIIPYRLTRYNLVLQGNIGERFLYNLNGTVRDYQMIIEEGNKQKYISLSGNIACNISRITNLSLQGSYLKQNGDGIDLNLITSRIQLNTRYRQIFITAGLEVYKNEFYNENLDFKKFNIRISRKF
ncbi:MAG: hypothetical protein Q8K04_06205 [Lutibacter sp.]|nr:hypothetical protein [Lutibacter sp.]